MDNLIGRAHPMADDFMLPNFSLFQTMVQLLFFCWAVKKNEIYIKEEKRTTGQEVCSSEEEKGKCRTLNIKGKQKLPSQLDGNARCSSKEERGKCRGTF